MTGRVGAPVFARAQPRSLFVRVVVPILLATAAWLNWVSPTVRLDSALANHVAFLVAMLVPLFALLLEPEVASHVDRWLTRLPLIPFALVGLLLSAPTAVGIYETARVGADPGFMPIARYEVAPLRFVVYRTKCGVTCSYGIVIRAESPLVPGLLFVRNVYKAYPADTAALRPLPGHRLEVAVPSRGSVLDRTARHETITLPWPWSPPGPGSERRAPGT